MVQPLSGKHAKCFVLPSFRFDPFSSIMRPFTSIPVLVSLLSFAILLRSEPAGTVIFADDFSRVEAMPEKEDLGNGWTTNSAWRAAGRKQVTLKDGVVIAGTSEGASHALVLFHDAVLRDGTLEVRFKIDAKESFSAEFCDPDCTTVHAGHLAMARVGGGRVSISDMKTGGMNLKLRERRLALKKGEKDAELDALMKSKEKSFPATVSDGGWHRLTFTLKGDVATVAIDDKVAGSLKSEGFAHPTKKQFRLMVGKSAEIDDVKVWNAD